MTLYLNSSEHASLIAERERSHTAFSYLLAARHTA